MTDNAQSINGTSALDSFDEPPPSGSCSTKRKTIEIFNPDLREVPSGLLRPDLETLDPNPLSPVEVMKVISTSKVFPTTIEFYSNEAKLVEFREYLDKIVIPSERDFIVTSLAEIASSLNRTYSSRAVTGELQTIEEAAFSRLILKSYEYLETLTPGNEIPLTYIHDPASLAHFLKGKGKLNLEEIAENTVSVVMESGRVIKKELDDIALQLSNHTRLLVEQERDQDDEESIELNAYLNIHESIERAIRNIHSVLDNNVTSITTHYREQMVLAVRAILREGGEGGFISSSVWENWIFLSDMLQQTITRGSATRKVLIASQQFHDARNLLSVVTLKLDLAKKAALLGKIEKFREAKNVVLEVISDADTLLNSIQIVKEPIPINDIGWNVRDAIENRLSLFLTQEVDVSIEIDTESLNEHFLIGSERALLSVLANLFSNTAKYSQASQLSISLKTKHIEGSPYLILDFSDNGIGIPEDIKDGYFEIGVSGSGSTGYGGAIIKAMAESCGGEVVLESTEGIGTSVKVHYPLKRPADLEA